MFLALVIPGPKHPGRDIDILLEPLIDELNKLWDVGEMTWDASRQENFNMKATLLWTVSDYPAYEMLCGWGTKGKLACYYCQGATKAFQLEHGGKPCWFDCHRCMLPMDHPFRRDKTNFIKGREEWDGPPPRLMGEQILEEVNKLGDMSWGKDVGLAQFEGYGVTHHWQKKSIFWSLPYWKDNLLPHNIDMMHTEKNFTEALVNTLLSMGKKTKDNEKARKDLALLCNRPKQHLTSSTTTPGKIKKPKAPFALSQAHKRLVLTWIKDKVKFPDGHGSNWSRCVNLTTNSLFGMKSHDWHVFMERLLPVAFRDFVPEPVWDVLCEVSSFFREICAKELDPSRIDQLERDIVVTICKMEKIFPPGFFNSMQHLVVHLAHEARMGGPVRSRWMYPCERRNKEQRQRVTNKARVEGSIVEATIVKEISTTSRCYFEDLTIKDPKGNEKCNTSRGFLSIFDKTGHHIGRENRRTLTDDEYKAAHTYVLLNCPEICDKYLGEFDAVMLNKGTTPERLWKARQDLFAEWLRQNIIQDLECDPYIRRAAMKPLKRVSCYEGYEINGYRYHTESHGQDKCSRNSGVCIKGETESGGTPQDYYGVLEEVIQLTYEGGNKVVLFKCYWFDITNGVKVDCQHGIVEVKHESRLKTYEPFVLACQAVQVSYLPYASMLLERKKWWVAFKTSPKGQFRHDEDDTNLEFYQEEMGAIPIEVSNGPGFDWDNAVIQEDEYDLVDDIMEVTPPRATNDSNPVEDGEEDNDMDEMDQAQQEAYWGQFYESEEDGF
ncbi:uncharacterized protein LOC144547837 [Carex rostrata]